MRISVIIVMHEGMPFISRCLDSVVKNSSEECQIIVVDNASTDGCYELVREHYPDLLLLRSEKNLGYAGGINEGLKHARGEYIAPLNMDIVVGANWLEPMCDFMDCHPKVGAVTPMIVIDQDRTRVNALGGAIHVTGMSFCNGLKRRVSSLSGAPFQVPGISGACFLIRQQRLRQLGGAPVECFMGNDDVVLSWSLRLLGDDIYCVPESVVYHHYHLTLDAKKLGLVERNRFAMLLATLRPSTLLCMTPLLVAQESAIALYCLARGPEFVRAKLSAMASLWSDRARIRDRRRALQALRQVTDWKLLSAMRKNLEWRQLFTTLGDAPPRHPVRTELPPDSEPENPEKDAEVKKQAR